MGAIATSRRTRSMAYDPVARALHWLTVLLIAAEYTVGLTMPGIHRNTRVSTLIAIHLALGSGILLLIVLRIAWRSRHRPPPPPPLPRWQRYVAAGTHAALYAALVLTPLTGWATASAHGWPVRAFGLLPLPALVAHPPHVPPWFWEAHVFMVYWVLLTLIIVHIAAALYHRLIRRDSVLSRMLPGL